jgi:peptidoglycan hydrolase CwlO-like protein
MTEVKIPRTRPRRRADAWPILTRVLKDVLVITGAIVSVIYSYGIGQTSNDTLINVQQQAKGNVERRTSEIEERIKVLNEQIEQLREGLK